MGLLRTIFFLIIFYYVFRFIVKVLFPLFITNRVRKMQNQHFGPSNNNYQHREKEGKVTIQKNTKSEKKTPDDLGEYVDYEEVK